MAFRFDEDHVALADGVEDLLLGRAKGEYARAVADGTTDWSELWAAVSELGIPAMAVPEELGGLGLGPIELVAVCERVGRHLAPAPIVATAGAFVPTANAAGGEPLAALEQVVAGAAATLAYVDSTDPATLELRGGSLFAADVPVPDAERVDLIGFVVADAEGQAHSLVVLAADAVELSPVEGFDRTRPLALVSVDGAAVAATPLPNGSADLSVAFATAAAELVGTAARMLELSVEHARERRQFGVPIGSFQAVKHRLVDALLELERARSLTYRAAVACAGDDPAAALRAARMAKAAASDTATGVGRAAVQVHGGLGITVEADVSLFYLRARQASMQLGGRDALSAALAARGSTG
jgi:alkylation response protein AidB-like acyl-CoA dehydrogenase